MWGWKFQNATSPTVFIGSHTNFMRTLLTMGECSLLLFLAISQVLQNLWHFESLTLESMGKPKMWSMLNMADRRAKRTKIWEPRYYSRIWWLLLMPDLSLVWGHSVHFAKFPILQFLKLCSSPNFYQIHPNFIQGILITGQYRQLCFGDLLKIKNNGTLKFFLTQDHMQLEISKCYFSHNFRWSPSKLYDNIGHHGTQKYTKVHRSTVLGFWFGKLYGKYGNQGRI